MRSFPQKINYLRANICYLQASSPQFSQNSQSFQELCPWTLPGGLTVPPGPPAEFRKTQSFCKMVVDKSAWEYPWFGNWYYYFLMLNILVSLWLVAINFGWFQVVSNGLEWFQVVCCFSSYRWKFHIKTPSTFSDMRMWIMWKVCLQTFRNNRIC